MEQDQQQPRRHRRKVIAGFVLGACIVLGTAAIAALTVTITQDATAGEQSIARCTASTTVSLGASTYDPTDARYEYANVSYSGAATCNGDTITITATNSANVALGVATGTIPNTGSGTLSWTANPPVADTVKVLVSIQEP